MCVLLFGSSGVMISLLMAKKPRWTGFQSRSSDPPPTLGVRGRVRPWTVWLHSLWSVPLVTFRICCHLSPFHNITNWPFHSLCGVYLPAWTHFVLPVEMLSNSPKLPPWTPSPYSQRTMSRPRPLRDPLIPPEGGRSLREVCFLLHLYLLCHAWLTSATKRASWGKLHENRNDVPVPHSIVSPGP